MMKSQIQLQKFRSSTAEAEFKAAKVTIASFWDRYKAEIKDRYLSFQGADGLSNRDEELWAPILIIAAVLDTELPEPFLLQEMMRLAKKITLQEKRTELVGNREAQILEGTQAYMIEEAPKVSGGGNLYVGEDLCRSIKDRWNIPGLRVETVSHVLKRHNLVLDVSRRRFRRDDNNLEFQRTCYLLDIERLSRLTADYFLREAKKP